MTFHFGCSAYNIQSDVCLERAIDFAWWNQACWFRLWEARNWLERDTNSCSKKCNVKIEGLEERPYYKLKYLALRIDGFVDNSKKINPKCSSSFTLYEEKTLEIFCHEGVDTSKNLCTFTEGCKDGLKTCVRSPTERVGFCVCKSGYIEFGNECLQGNLKLNDRCQQSEQFSGTVGSICQSYRCVCRPGSTPLNDSFCFSRNLKLNDRCQQSEQCSGTVGSECQSYRCVCRPGSTPLNGSFCFSLDTSKNLCTFTEACADQFKTCVRSQTEQVGFCVCKSGYIGFGNECLEGNLKLNDCCQQSEQCSGTVGSVCQSFRCVCRPGSIPLNDSNCFSRRFISSFYYRYCIN
ncbi:fibrillin-1-like isoform X3 [Saccostrea cucullata]|uniref:fibrillin-1-like isoform X3 n=1 Tax=Saccostrea cuccullata TaxID=36930 RepID=UPI002ED40971